MDAEQSTDGSSRPRTAFACRHDLPRLERPRPTNVVKQMPKGQLVKTVTFWLRLSLTRGKLLSLYWPEESAGGIGRKHQSERDRQRIRVADELLAKVEA